MRNDKTRILVVIKLESRCGWFLISLILSTALVTNQETNHAPFQAEAMLAAGEATVAVDGVSEGMSQKSIRVSQCLLVSVVN